MVTHGRAVNDSPMPYGAFVAYSKRRIGIHVQRAIVLDVRPATNHDGSRIAPYHSIVPNTCTLSNSDIADHCRARCNENILSNSGPNAVVGEDGHGFLLFTFCICVRG